MVLVESTIVSFVLTVLVARTTTVVVIVVFTDNVLTSSWIVNGSGYFSRTLEHPIEMRAGSESARISGTGGTSGATWRRRRGRYGPTEGTPVTVVVTVELTVVLKIFLTKYRQLRKSIRR